MKDITMAATLMHVQSGLKVEEAADSDSLTVELSDRISRESVSEYLRVLTNAIDDATATDELCLDSLRHIVVSTEFVTDTQRLLQQLGLPDIVTSTKAAQAVGKTISWLHQSQPVSILIFPHELVSQYSSISLARGIIHHELAHVHDDKFRHDVLGPTPHPDARDLDAVIAYVSGVLWSEYFAERTAKRHYSHDDLMMFADNHEIITDCLRHIREEVLRYRQHEDILYLWQQSISTANIILGVIGRTLGECHPHPDHQIPYDAFLTGVPHDASLLDVIRDTDAVLDRLYTTREVWTRDALHALHDVAYDTLQLFGVYPRTTAEGLYVDVP
jgi:hypothetical protein